MNEVDLNQNRDIDFENHDFDFENHDFDFENHDFDFENHDFDFENHDFDFENHDFDFLNHDFDNHDFDFENYDLDFQNHEFDFENYDFDFKIKIMPKSAATSVYSHAAFISFAINSAINFIPSLMLYKPKIWLSMSNSFLGESILKKVFFIPTLM